MKPFNLTYIPQHNRTIYGVVYNKESPTVDEILTHKKMDIKWCLVFYFGERYKVYSNYQITLK